MISYLVGLIEGILIPAGALGVFGALFIQEIIVFIPSSLVMLAAGFVLLSPLEPFSGSFFGSLLFQIVIPAAAGSALGSLVVFGIAYRYGKPFFDRFGRYFSVSWDDVLRLKEKLSGTYADELVIFSLRAIPIFPNTAISVLCGIIRWSVPKYLAISFFGEAIRALAMALIGFQAGVFYHDYVAVFDALERYVIVFFAVIALSAAWFFYWRRRRATKTAPPVLEGGDKML